MFGFPVFTYYKDSLSCALRSLREARCIPPPTYFCCFWILGWPVWKKGDRLHQELEEVGPPNPKPGGLVQATERHVRSALATASTVLKPNQRWMCEDFVQEQSTWDVGWPFYHDKGHSSRLRVVGKSASEETDKFFEQRSEKWADPTQCTLWTLRSHQF